MASASHETPEVFAVTRTGGAGLTRRQTQGTSFVTPTVGVRLRADVEATHQTAATIALTARPDATLTDISAARAWGLPLPTWLQDAPVSAAVRAGNSHTRRPGTRGRRLRLPDDHLTLAGGQSITTPARTWLDCAEFLPLGHLVAMGDAALHRGLTTQDELHRMCTWAFRRRGVAVARQAERLLDGRAESPGESLCRVALVTGGIERPECNVDIITADGWLARVDLLWRAQRVIGEYDGAVHVTEEQRRTDAARRNLLQEAGYYVLVFTARDLRRPEAMCATVRSALRSRAPR